MTVNPQDSYDQQWLRQNSIILARNVPFATESRVMIRPLEVRRWHQRSSKANEMWEHLHSHSHGRIPNLYPAAEARDIQGLRLKLCTSLCRHLSYHWTSETTSSSTRLASQYIWIRDRRLRPNVWMWALRISWGLHRWGVSGGKIMTIHLLHEMEWYWHWAAYSDGQTGVQKTVAVKALGRMMVMEAMAMLSKESETVARWPGSPSHR